MKNDNGLIGDFVDIRKRKKQLRKKERYSNFSEHGYKREQYGDEKDIFGKYVWLGKVYVGGQTVNREK